MKAYAELYDLELLEVIVDAGESAKSLDRPGLKRALGMLKAGDAEALLVVKLDRLTRSVVDLGTLVERYFAPGKAALLSVGEQIDTRSAAGRLVLNVLASVSQWEREAIGERTSTAMQYKAKQGEYTGGQAPYGRRVAPCGARLEPAPDEVAARAVARDLRAQGLSLRGVAAELERRGVRSRTGRGFAPVQVKRMVGQEMRVAAEPLARRPTHVLPLASANSKPMSGRQHWPASWPCPGGPLPASPAARRDARAAHHASPRARPGARGLRRAFRAAGHVRPRGRPHALPREQPCSCPRCATRRPWRRPRQPSA